MRILIRGGAVTHGQHHTQRLVRERQGVTALARLGAQAHHYFGASITKFCHQLSCCVAVDTVASELLTRHEAEMHLAAQTAAGEASEKWYAPFQKLDIEGFDK